MDDENFTSGSFCKTETMAEILFHSHTFEAQSTIVLCSRLLARHRPNGVCNNYEGLDQKSLNEIDTNEHQVEDCNVCDYKDILEDKQLTHDEKHCFVDINEPGLDCPEQTVSSTEDTCSSIQEQFKNLSTNESEEDFEAKWYAYWEKNGENFINKKWLEKYADGSDDEFSMNISELYEKHREEQYNLLYWKYLFDNYKNDIPSTDESREANAKWLQYWAENGHQFETEKWIEKYGSWEGKEHLMYGEELYKKHCEEQYYALYWKYLNEINNDTNKVNSDNNENDNSDQSSSNSSVHLNNINNISNFEFIYKYKHFDHVSIDLIRAYQTLSLIGYNYDNQQIFHSAFVRYLKTNLIKSTRHLNIYRFPKMMNSKKCEIKDTPSNCGMDSETGSENTVISNNNKQYELSFLKNLSKDNSEDSVGINKEKSKKLFQKEKFELERAERLDKELERTGYSYLKNNSKLLKYWKKRYFLFSQFEKGIRLDEESWYSVTPELISAYIAERCSCYVLVDAFCGAGGNAIQFAKTCQLVIAIDIDPKKIEMARHNAELYGVADRIEFIVGDYFLLAPTLKADVVFLSPPWGGPRLMNLENYRLYNIMAKNGGGEYLLSLTRKITSNIALHLPKNINIFDCIKSVENGFIEVQQNVLNSRYNSITVYYNQLYGLGAESTVEYYL